jgi:hypothetical protein
MKRRCVFSAFERSICDQRRTDGRNLADSEPRKNRQANRGATKIDGKVIPRWRIVGTVGVATVLPAWTLLVILAVGGSLLSSTSAAVAALTGAFVAFALRGIGALARWLVLGPGLSFDRLLWSASFAASLAVAAAWQFEIHELLFAFLAYFGVHVVIGSVADAAFSEGPRVPKKQGFRMSLSDLLTALSAFGVLVGATRFLLGNLRRADAYDLPFVFIASTLGSFVVAAVALVVDAGVGFLAIGADPPDGRMLVGIGCFFVLVGAAMGLAIALVSNEPELAALSGFAAAYLTFAAAQEEFLARTIET